MHYRVQALKALLKTFKRHYHTYIKLDYTYTPPTKYNQLKNSYLTNPT